MAAEQDIGKTGDQATGDQKASDGIKVEARFTDSEKQDTWIQTQQEHKLGEHESATMKAVTEAERTKINADGYQKLEIVGLEHSPADSVSNSDGSRIALRDDYYNRHQFDKESKRESYIPPGARPGVDYFEVSDFVQRKGLQDALKASPQLARNLAEIQNCKWAADIHVWQHHPAAEYDAKTSVIEVDPTQSHKRQIEIFAHESYHATHQDLDSLYGGQKPVSEIEFVNIKMRQEAGAFLRETLVNEDLRKNSPELGSTPIEYIWVDPANPIGEPRRQVINDLLVRNGSHVDEGKSQLVIEKFLREHPAAIGKSDGSGYERDSRGNLMANDYEQQKREGYAGYSNPENFRKTKDHLKKSEYI